MSKQLRHRPPTAKQKNNKKSCSQHHTTKHTMEQQAQHNLRELSQIDMNSGTASHTLTMTKDILKQSISGWNDNQNSYREPTTEPTYRYRKRICSSTSRTHNQTQPKNDVNQPIQSQQLIKTMEDFEVLHTLDVLKTKRSQENRPELEYRTLKLPEPKKILSHFGRKTKGYKPLANQTYREPRKSSKNMMYIESILSKYEKKPHKKPIKLNLPLTTENKYVLMFYNEFEAICKKNR